MISAEEQKKMDWNTSTFALAQASLGAAILHIGELKDVKGIKGVTKHVDEASSELDHYRKRYLESVQ